MKIKFNTNILKWAIRRNNLSLSELSKKLGIKEEKIKNFINGKEFPTYKQLHKLADVLRIPFGYFFLETLPQEEIDIPDFRRNKKSIPLSQIFFEIYYDTKNKQDWIKQKRLKNDFPQLDFVGRFSPNDSPKEIAIDIQNTLEIVERDFGKNPLEMLLTFSNKAENKGILVLKNSILFNNTHIKLDPMEFRGFVLVDKIAPLIFINAADSIKAQIFTLFHELAHIWIGESGISDVDLENQNHIERLCNQVAAEILMPEERIEKYWNKNLKPLENIRELSRKFGISKQALSYRALNLGFISQKTQKEIIKILKKEWLEEKQEENKKTEKGGGDYYKTLPIRNSKTFTNEVINSLISGEILYKEAAQLLNVKNIKILNSLIENTRGTTSATAE